MKKIVLAIGLVAASIYGCKKINPIEGVEKIVDVTFSNTSVTFQFVDAVTGQQIGLDVTKEISIAITGKNADDIVDNFGGTQIGADYGIMAVALREGVIPSRTNQVFFTVQATTEGYLPASSDVVILEEGHQHIIVEMVNVNDAPTGMAVDQDVITGVPSSGVTASTFTLSPTALSTTGTTASVTIPSGTKFMDANSVAVSGDVTATIAYSNPQEEGFGKLFPGSLDVASMADGTYATFKTLGLISMELNTSSKEIKKFGTPIQMTVQIPAGSTDMDGNAVVAGSTFGVYSYDNTTGQWTHESDETVVSNNGNLEVTFEMEHLSIWQYAYKGLRGNELRYPIEVQFTSQCIDNLKSQKDIYIERYIYLTGNLLTNGYATIPMGKSLALINDDNSVFLSCSDPLLGAYRYKWYRKTDENDFVEISADGCTGKDIQTVNIPSSWCPAAPKDFTIKLETSCPDNPDRKIQPQCPVFAAEEGALFAPWKPLGQMQHGELKTTTANFEAGKKYALITFYQNKMVALTGTLAGFDLGYRTFDGEDVDLSRQLTSQECSYLGK